MIVDNVTHDEKNNDKWYVNRKIEDFVRVRKVKAMQLSTCIKKYLKNEDIHFLKIDAQGSDIDVFESCGEFIEQLLFVQIETVFSKNKNIILYENQKTFKDDYDILLKHGFRIFGIHDYTKRINNPYFKKASPEADVVFVNVKLLEKYIDV